MKCWIERRGHPSAHCFPFQILFDIYSNKQTYRSIRQPLTCGIRVLKSSKIPRYLPAIASDDSVRQWMD